METGNSLSPASRIFFTPETSTLTRTMCQPETRPPETVQQAGGHRRAPQVFEEQAGRQATEPPKRRAENRVLTWQEEEEETRRPRPLFHPRLPPSPSQLALAALPPPRPPAAPP